MSPAQPGRTLLVSAIPSDSLLAISAHWRLEKENSVRGKFASSVGEHDEGAYLR